MPRVHRFIPVRSARSEAQRLSALGLHIGIDLQEPESLFGTGWDRDARDLGRGLRSQGVKVVARGPGWEHPVGTCDPFFVDQIRAYHDRAIATASHLGAEHYIVRLGPFFGLSRLQRLARQEATNRMLSHLSERARASGLMLVVQQHLEHELRLLELAADQLRELKGGLIVSPARAACSSWPNLAEFVAKAADVLVALDLTDLRPDDLEPRVLRTGILERSEDWTSLMECESLGYFVVDLPSGSDEELVRSLNSLARTRLTRSRPAL